ncbi:dihydroneopterin aldolase [Myxococcota bacterium]|nr:dihydroneopterin aldolase [Myxococcota bacterium]
MSFADRVCVEGLELMAEVGVYAHEHGIKQRLVIDLVVETELRAAGQSDALADAIDYDGLAKIARDVASSRHHELIEAIAEEIAAGVLASLGVRAGRVKVRVAKPGAVPDARTVAVEIWRSHA